MFIRIIITLLVLFSNSIAEEISGIPKVVDGDTVHVDNYKLRLEILKKKIEVLNINIPIDVLKFVASKIVNNIRELEGALNRIWANYELTGKKINIENSTNLLSDLISAHEKTISIESIQKKVSSYYNLLLSDMSSSEETYDLTPHFYLVSLPVQSHTSCSPAGSFRP